MKTIRMSASHPDFEYVSGLQERIAALKNPHVHMNLRRWPKSRLTAEIVILEKQLEQYARVPHSRRSMS